MNITTQEFLHQKFNPRSDQIPPVRLKRFKRQNLAKLFGELGFRRGAEVGVAEGKFSVVLCESIPDLHLSAVDLWKPYKRDDHYLKNQSMQDEALALAHEKLDKHNVTFICEPSTEAVKQFEPGSLDFVYIDADHAFDFVMQDLIVWSKIVKSGGIVSGHDYYRFRGAGVVDAVNAYTHAHQINEWFVCDERETSFFWANP